MKAYINFKYILHSIFPAKVAMQVVEYLKMTLKNLETFKKSNTHAVELVGSKLLKVRYFFV